MGHPRDICHSLGLTSLCAQGRIGDGIWDRAAYFRSNHPGLSWQTTDGLGANVTRYATYLWEAAEEAANPNTRLVSRATADDASLATYRHAPGRTVPGAGGRARYQRQRPAAGDGGGDHCRTVNATIGLNGKKQIPVAGYIDVFLVEPSLDRTRCSGNKAPCKDKFTDANDVYVEVIGASGSGAGGGAGQITRRDVPYLIE